jgi:hypothetical protein
MAMQMHNPGEEASATIEVATACSSIASFKIKSSKTESDCETRANGGGRWEPSLGAEILAGSRAQMEV